MAKQTKQDKLDLRMVELPHYSYQPSVAGLNEDMTVDASCNELVRAVLQPLKIRYVTPPKRKP